MFRKNSHFCKLLLCFVLSHDMLEFSQGVVKLTLFVNGIYIRTPAGENEDQIFVVDNFAFSPLLDTRRGLECLRARIYL